MILDFVQQALSHEEQKLKEVSNSSVHDRFSTVGKKQTLKLLVLNCDEVRHISRCSPKNKRANERTSKGGETSHKDSTVDSFV